MSYVKKDFNLQIKFIFIKSIFFIIIVSSSILYSDETANKDKPSMSSRSLPSSEAQLKTIQTKESKDISKWNNLPEKKLQSRLKSYAFAKVRTSLLPKLSFTKEVSHQYSQCPEMFPAMPGEFPCSLLIYNGSLDTSSKDPSAEYKAGGTISIAESANKIPLIGGIALQIGVSTNDIEANTDSIIAYYNPNGLISHYKYKQRVVVFNWTDEDKEPTLKSLISVELNSDNWVKSGEEIDYSK